MSNGKFAKRKGIATKAMFMILAVVLIVGISVGGTLAWLTATTGPVTNTFTVGDIKITLDETGATNNAKNYTFVPGDKLAKDPTVTVVAGSESCYLFVKVVDVHNTIPNTDPAEKIINWSVATGWTAVTGHAGYWYREVTSSSSAQEFPVLADDVIASDDFNGSVSVSTKVTKDMVTTLTANPPQIIITAAAVQKDNIDTVAAAFAELPNEFTATTP